MRCPPRRVKTQLRQIDIEDPHRVEHQAREQAAAVGVEQVLQGAADPVIVEQRALRRGEAEEGSIERARPLMQGVQRRVLQHQVADDHPERLGVRQAHAPIGVRDEALEQRLEADALDDAVDDRQAPQLLGNEDRVTQVRQAAVAGAHGDSLG